MGFIPAKYVRLSKLREYFISIEPDGSKQKIRIAEDAKQNVADFFDRAIKNAVYDIIRTLPVKTKGNDKGDLKRFTIQSQDLDELTTKQRNTPEIIFYNRIRKELFVYGDQKIRVASDAHPYVISYLEGQVQHATIELIWKLPRKSRGESAGELKRFTIQAQDF